MQLMLKLTEILQLKFYESQSSCWQQKEWNSIHFAFT